MDFTTQLSDLYVVLHSLLTISMLDDIYVDDSGSRFWMIYLDVFN